MKLAMKTILMMGLVVVMAACGKDGDGSGNHVNLATIPGMQADCTGSGADCVGKTVRTNGFIFPSSVTCEQVIGTGGGTRVLDSHLYETFVAPANNVFQVGGGGSGTHTWNERGGSTTITQIPMASYTWFMFRWENTGSEFFHISPGDPYCCRQGSAWGFVDFDDSECDIKL